MLWSPKSDKIQRIPILTFIRVILNVISSVVVVFLFHTIMEENKGYKHFNFFVKHLNVKNFEFAASLRFCDTHYFFTRCLFVNHDIKFLVTNLITVYTTSILSSNFSQGLTCWETMLISENAIFTTHFRCFTFLESSQSIELSA